MALRRRLMFAAAAQSCRAAESWHDSSKAASATAALALSSADAASRLGGGSCFAARMWRGDVRASAVRLLCGSSIERTRWLSQAESTYIYIYQVRRKETASQARDGQNRKAPEGQRKKTKTITNAKLTTARHRATAMPSCVDGLYDARRQINIVEALALKNS